MTAALRTCEITDRRSADPRSPCDPADLAGLTTLVGAYRAQSVLVFPHFDRLGTSSLKQTVEVLGEPLKISTWSQFYKLAGPPVFARFTGAVLSFYLAGCAQGYFAARWSPAAATPAPTPTAPVARAAPKAAPHAATVASAPAAGRRPVPAAAAAPADRPIATVGAPSSEGATPATPVLSFEEYQRRRAAKAGAAAAGG